MTEQKLTLAERGADAMKRLIVAAEKLNGEGAKLEGFVTLVEDAINRLHVGVRASCIMAAPPTSNLHKSKLGYGKNPATDKWGIYIETVDGRQQGFYDAPRYMQIKAIDHLPDLMVALATTADVTKEKLDVAMVTARQVLAGFPPDVVASIGADTGTVEPPSRPAKRPLGGRKRRTPDPGPPETPVSPAKPLEGASYICRICTEHGCGTCHERGERCPCARDGRT